MDIAGVKLDRFCRLHCPLRIGTIKANSELCTVTDYVDLSTEVLAIGMVCNMATLQGTTLWII
jgi:hypothetical protein